MNAGQYEQCNQEESTECEAAMASDHGEYIPLKTPRVALSVDTKVHLKDDEDPQEDQLNNQEADTSPLSKQAGASSMMDCVENSQVEIEASDDVASSHHYPEVIVQHGFTHRQRSQRDIDMMYTLTWRELLQKHMTSRFGVYLELINTTLSVMCCVFYLVQLYMPEEYADFHFRYVEMALTCFFALHYLLQVYTEDDVKRYVVSADGIIDLVTILPAFIMFFSDTQSSKVLTVFRVFRVFRALRILRLYRLIRSRKHGYNYEWFVFTFSIGAVIFAAAGIFQALEDYPDRGRPIYFHDSLYFILVTLATIGYGDIVATTILSEFFVMALIVAVVTVVPTQLSRLNALRKPHYSYDDTFHSNPHRGHVIVCGYVTHESFSDFLAEFYHPSRGVVNFDVVVLSSEPPTGSITRLLSNVIYSSKTTYLKGSLFNEKDRARVQLETAEAVFVLANRNNDSSDAEDASTLLQALSVRNYADSTGRRIRTYLQMISDSHNELSHIIGASQTINASKMKDDIVARGTVCPGACALILNLIQSVDEMKYKKYVAGPTQWMQEYVGGMSRQIYAMMFSSVFDGHLYQDVARRVFDGFEVILLAVYRREKDDRHTRVCLCPFGKPILEGDIGFFIAASSHLMHKVLNEYSEFAHQDVIIRARSTSFRQMPLISTLNLLHRQSPRSRTLKSKPSRQQNTTPHNSAFAMKSPDLKNSLLQATKKETKQMHQHIVLCGSLRHVVPLIRLLRSMYHQLEGVFPTVVVLADTLPEVDDFPTEWHLPEDVFFVHGTSLRCADLIRVGAQQAKSVLIFPFDSQQHATQPDADTENSTCLLDYGVVTSLLCLETAIELSHHAKGTEFPHEESVSCACQRDNISHGKFPRASSLQSISTRLRHNSTCCSDTPLWQWQHEYPCVAVLQRGSNIKFCRPRDVHFSSDHFPYLSPAYAAGRVFVDSRLDLLLCQAFYNPYITEVIQALAGGQEDTKRPFLSLADIPTDFIGQNFGDLYAFMLSIGKLVVGLYRFPHRRLGNLLPYVYTCPLRSTHIHCKDKMFVVAERES